MQRTDQPQSSDFLVYAIGRPLMLVFWMLILWGTLYGSALLYRSVMNGPTAAVRQALSGGDATVGLVSLALSLCAAAVWTALAVGMWQKRRRSADPRDGGEPT
jgi:hypothetical protein